MSEDPFAPKPELSNEGADAERGDADRGAIRKVQCPNCCRMAPVTSRKMGLLFYECELCGTSGATPEEHQPPTSNAQLPNNER